MTVGGPVRDGMDGRPRPRPREAIRAVPRRRAAGGCGLAGVLATGRPVPSTVRSAASVSLVTRPAQTRSQMAAATAASVAS